jgi:hypothetical protein
MPVDDPENDLFLTLGPILDFWTSTFEFWKRSAKDNFNVSTKEHVRIWVKTRDFYLIHILCGSMEEGGVYIVYS